MCYDPLNGIIVVFQTELSDYYHIFFNTAFKKTAMVNEIKNYYCNVRESNPGRPRGRRAFYHWTNVAYRDYSWPKWCLFKPCLQLFSSCLNQLRMEFLEVYVKPKLKNKNRLIYNILWITKPLWRNWLARSAVNRKVGGSSPPRGDRFIFKYWNSRDELKIVAVSISNWNLVGQKDQSLQLLTRILESMFNHSFLQLVWGQHTHTEIQEQKHDQCWFLVIFQSFFNFQYILRPFGKVEKQMVHTTQRQGGRVVKALDC